MKTILPRHKGNNGQTSPDTLEEDIEATKGRIIQTINQITSKMNPKSIGSELGAFFFESIEHFDLGEVRRFAVKSAEKTGRVIRENPLPVALGCLAAASLLLPRKWRSLRREEEEHHHLRSAAAAASREAEALAESARAAGHTVSELAGRGLEKLENLAGKASEKISSASQHTVETAKESTARLRTAATDTAENHPLGMALGALALGFLASLAIPRSRSEEKLMEGESVGRVKQFVNGVGTSLSRNAKEILHENEMDAAGLQKRAIRGIDHASKSKPNGRS